MAVVPGPGSRPRLIALFDVTAGHGADYALPSVLGWDKVARIYEVDEKTTDWLTQQRGSDTVAGFRSLLSRYKRPR